MIPQQPHSSHLAEVADLPQAHCHAIHAQEEAQQHKPAARHDAHLDAAAAWGKGSGKFIRSASSASSTSSKPCLACDTPLSSSSDSYSSRESKSRIGSRLVSSALFICSLLSRHCSEPPLPLPLLLPAAMLLLPLSGALLPSAAASTLLSTPLLLLASTSRSP